MMKTKKLFGRIGLLKLAFLSLAIGVVVIAGLVFFHEKPSVTNQFIEVNHPFTGSSPKLLTDVSYDVDSNRSLSINDTKYVIENAQNIANANNWDVELYSKFHFWPNIFDLTEIYFRDKDLYTRIIDEILEKNHDKDIIIAKMNSEISDGNRIFLARDFIPIVEYNGRVYYEVNYGFIINLDKRYVEEILIHNKTLIVLHDPNIDELMRLFNKTNLPEGEIWELCLRGNIKRTKYNSIIVDRVNNSGFFVKRVHLSCGCYYYFEENLPGIPKIPIRNPPIPKPEEKIPLPPKNPNHPKPPFIHPKKNGGVTTPSPPMRPWPFPNPEPKDTMPIPSNSNGESDQQCSENEELLQQKSQLLENLRSEVNNKRDKFNNDIKNLNNNFSYSYYLPGEWINNTKFNNPCIEEAYNSYNEKVKVIKKQINKLREEQGNISNAISSLAKQLGRVIDSYRYRSSIWQNMLHGDSNSEWTKVSVPCGGGIIMPGHSSALPRINITPEQQMAFRKDVLSGVMNGKTWGGAVNEAILKHISANNSWGNHTWIKIWEMYANCLKKLYTKQLKIFLKNSSIYPDASDEEIKQMINIMFNGSSALTEEQEKQLAQFNKQKEKYLEQQKKIEKAIEKLNNQIDNLRWKFRDDIRENCLKASRKEINQTWQTIWIIESFLEYCKNHNGVYEFQYINREIFCTTLNKMLNNPTYNSNLALKEFIQLLIRNHCRD